jgi:hypothetical protein
VTVYRMTRAKLSSTASAAIYGACLTRLSSHFLNVTLDGHWAYFFLTDYLNCPRFSRFDLSMKLRCSWRSQFES